MEMNWPEIVYRCFDADRVVYSSHAKREMREEEFGAITDQEVYEAIQSGAVIEMYPDDKPYPSALLFGTTASSRPLHAVYAYDSDHDQVIVVTVYQPDPARWEDYRRRKR